MTQHPQTIGPYRLLEHLGQGGMGVVYRAQHLHSGQTVALKTVRVPHQGQLSAIRREIHALSRLRHPGVVRIVDEGLEDRLPWYAMELLEGVTLRRHAGRFAAPTASQVLSGPESSSFWPSSKGPEKSGSSEWWTASLAEAGPADGWKETAPVPAAAVPGGLKDWGKGLVPLLSLLRQLCETLAFLHGEGIVHRDLKPDNIILRNFEFSILNSELERHSAQRAEIQNSKFKIQNPVRPVLVDFGLMARSGGPLSRDALEVGGVVVGTIAYIAPEQIRGELVDARADLYALGCMLFELLTGRPPFEGATRGQTLSMHLQETPAPPSLHVGGIPAELDALVLRLLAKDPAERLGHALDVAAALERLGAETPFSGDAPRPRPYLYRPGFSGREEVMQTLRGPLRRLVAGAGGALLIDGESGVGKTRLVVEIAREARQSGLRVLTGECLPVPALLNGLGPLLQAVADRCREGGAGETERLLGKQAEVLAGYAPGLAALLGREPRPERSRLPAPAARRRLFRALAGALSTLAGPAAPLLFVLDDLQWAGELTLGFLELLLHEQRLEPAGVLLLGTYRTEEAGALAQLLEQRAAERLSLRRLEETAVGALAGGMLGLASPPPQFVRFLARHSEGNPFFVAEYLRTAVQEGLLGRDSAGRWQMSGAGRDYEGLPLPHSLRELVGRRLDGLGPGARALLEVASVLGREFEADLFEQVAETTDTAAFLEALEELRVRQVLEESGAPGRSPLLRFLHDKLREAAGERVEPGRRRELHRAAAEALDRRPEAEPAVLGQHWELAGVPERARGPYLQAARAARALYSHEEAERLYRSALHLWEAPTAESIGARNELGQDALSVQGKAAEAISEHRKALEEARFLGLRAREAESLGHLASVEWRTGRMEEAERLYRQALALSHDLGDQRGEGRLLSSFAGVCHQTGRSAEAVRLYEQALEIQRRLGDREGEGLSLGSLANCIVEQGRNEEALALYLQAIEVHRERGDRINEGSTLSNMTTVHANTAQVEEGYRIALQALDLHREVGNRPFEGWTLGQMANLACEQGRIAEARALREQALAIHREGGNRRLESWTLGQAANWAAQTDGDLEEAGRQVEQAERIALELGDALGLAVHACTRGHILLAQGISAAETLAKAEAAAVALGVDEQSHLASSLGRLRRAQRTWQQDGGASLHRGWHHDDLSPGLHIWLQASGRRG